MPLYLEQDLMLVAHPPAPEQDPTNKQQTPQLPTLAQGRVVGFLAAAQLVAADYHSGMVGGTCLLPGSSAVGGLTMQMLWLMLNDKPAPPASY